MPPSSAGTDLLLVPSYSADPRTLASIQGMDSWVERHLIELRHLLHPGNRLVLVSPTPISEACLDAVLKLIPAAPAAWLHDRFQSLCLNDRSPRSLTHKLLDRPRLLEQLKAQLRPGSKLGCYAVSNAEMVLAEQLNLQLEGTPAALAELGSKAGSAQVFADLALPHPRTTPLCLSLEQLGDASAELLLGQPDIQRLVVKLNRLAGWIADGAMLVACLVLLWLVGLTCVDVVGRYFFRAPVTGATELVQISMAGIIFFSLPAMFLRDDQVIVDLFSFVRKGWFGW
ncbi:MAG: TRAP transporter small permease, partial [Synechococcaceae bacterium WB9_4xB_025]|nr:TRAP transporter small permease [Synechococcaceae bacterium WB9_4xB_025]